MANKDREKWDLRYRKDSGQCIPSRVLQKYINHAPPGRALDIACGNGRNSIALVQRGFTVDAVDISEVATQNLADRALGINVKCQDIDDWVIPENSYELIINIRFLDRRLFSMIEKGLKPGGMLIFESFTGGVDKIFCLTPNELLHSFPSLHVLYYEEKPVEDPSKFEKSASIVAIKNE